jgi:hypothetical protein
MTDNSEEIRVLFRYRDLTANTLAEHEKVLNTNGKCWWGWWKRPEEDAREGVWKYLAEQTKGGKRLAIGLFDTGATSDETAVRRAYIDRVISPKTGKGGVGLETPKLANRDQQLIPDYYRYSQYSRAWMRIVKIEPKPLEFFKHYVFDGAPPLRNIPSDYLDVLDGKVIQDRDELRIMDTTIWGTVRGYYGNTLNALIYIEL